MTDAVRKTRNYWLLLVQGVCIDASRHIASPRLVLPYIYLALGGPVFFAGLMLPVMQVARLTTPVVALPFIHATAGRKWFVVAALLVKAGVLAAIGLAADSLTATLIVAIFFLAALSAGMVQGINSVAYNDLVGRVFHRDIRQAMLYRKSALAGVVALALAAALGLNGVGSQSVSNDILFLLQAAALTLCGSLILIFVHEPVQRSVRPARDTKSCGPARGFFRTRHADFIATTRHSWFRRLLVAGGLLLSVELAMPFYAIHAATQYERHVGNISLFVVATSLAVIVGGSFWPRVSRNHEHVAMTGAAILAAAAAGLSIAIELVEALRHPAIHAIVFFCIAMAAQGVATARTLFVVARASNEERASFLAVGNLIVGAVSVAMASLFGYVAHIHGAIWPVFMIGGLNLLAALYCTRLHDEVSEESL